MIEDATPERRKRGDIAREIIEQDGGYMPRMRVKPVFTPYEMRVQIIDEASSVHAGNDAAIKRSIRRRLTKLDRALSDEEARALDRAFNAWLLFEGKGKSVNPMAVHGGSTNAAWPLNVAAWHEATQFACMRPRLTCWARMVMQEWFLHMAGIEGGAQFTFDSMLAVARAIKAAYEQK